MNKHLFIPIIVTTLIAGGGGFWAGMKYEQRKAPVMIRGGNWDNLRQQGSRSANSPFSRNGNGFRPVTGEILSLENNSVTITLSDGSSKLILLTDSTTVNKATEVDMTALVTGETVSVFGTQNSDGSVTAQSIQLNPALPRPIHTTPSSAQ